MTAPWRSAPVLIAVVGGDGRVVMVSDALAQTCDLESSDIVGRRPDELPPSGLVGTVARCAAQGTPPHSSRETALPTPEGIRHFRISSYPVGPEEGRGTAAIAVDVTDERRLQSALQVAQKTAASKHEALGRLLQISSDRMLVIDTDSRVVAFNASCQQFFADRYGVHIDEGVYLDQALGGAGPNGERVLVQWSRALAGEEFTEASVEEQGRKRHYSETSYAAIRGSDGQIVAVAATARDVTELRSLEGQLRQSQKLEAVGQLTGGIAHEINNLLTVVNATCDILREPMAGAGLEIRRDLEAIRSAAGRGTALIRKLLSFSRRQSLEMRPIDLTTTVYELSDVLSRILPEHVTVDTRVHPPISSVLADIGAVEQIVINLATNARDAMPDGGRFSLAVYDAVLDDEYCGARPGATPGNYVCIAVTDTGMGMDQDTLAMVFEPFFTTKPRGLGTGLGMSMIYGLVKQQRGYVDIESELGIGTTVRIFLPATTRRDGTPVSESPRTRVRNGTETILLVEDQFDLRRAGQRILERFGYRVLLAADGEEAIEIFEKHRGGIDLVVTDVIMPRMGGKQLYERIGKQEGAPRFLFTSGYSAEDLLRDSLLAPGQPLLHKPWSLEEFVQQVQESLSSDAGASTDASSASDPPNDEPFANFERFRRLT